MWLTLASAGPLGTKAVAEVAGVFITALPVAVSMAGQPSNYIELTIFSKCLNDFTCTIDGKITALVKKHMIH